MKASDFSIKQGGLMRCCIQTLMETELEAKPKDGDTIRCSFCGEAMTMHKGFWQWDPDPKEAG
jgi:hypothetical protein